MVYIDGSIVAALEKLDPEEAELLDMQEENLIEVDETSEEEEIVYEFG